ADDLPFPQIEFARGLEDVGAIRAEENKTNFARLAEQNRPALCEDPTIPSLKGIRGELKGTAIDGADDGTTAAAGRIEGHFRKQFRLHVNSVEPSSSTLMPLGRWLSQPRKTLPCVQFDRCTPGTPRPSWGERPRGHRYAVLSGILPLRRGELPDRRCDRRID